MYRNGVNVFPDEVDVVTGGFPCQDFSVAGKRNGFNSHKNHKGDLIEEECASVETRGQLYMWMKEVIEITQPKIFIAENVKGLVNLGDVKSIIQKDFSSANGNGYIVLDPQVLHSANFGVPQSRERVIFIGIKKSALKKSALAELEKEFFDLTVLANELSDNWFAARLNNNIAWCKIQTASTTNIFCKRFAQLWNSCSWAVTRLSIFNRFVHCINNILWSRNV